MLKKWGELMELILSIAAFAGLLFLSDYKRK